TNNGNDIKQTASFVIDGEVRDVVDAYFATDTVNTVYDDDYTLDPETLSLPTARGYGTLPDLHIAMSLDNSGTGNLEFLVSDFAGLSAGDIFAGDTTAMDAVKDVMFRWAGVDGVDPASRGSFVDAQELGFLE